jgi:hypothetical protein
VQVSAGSSRFTAYEAAFHLCTSAVTTALAKRPSASLFSAARRVISAVAEIALQTCLQLLPVFPVFHHAASDGPGDAAHVFMHRATMTKRRSIVMR